MLNQVIQLVFKSNPVDDALRAEILSLLRGIPTGYRASYIIAMINGSATQELRYTHKQINGMLDSMVAQNYIRLESGNFKEL